MTVVPKKDLIVFVVVVVDVDVTSGYSWKLLVSNFEFLSTKDRPNFLKCVFVKINGSDVNNKIVH